MGSGTRIRVRKFLSQSQFARRLYCALRSIGTSRKVRGRNNHLEMADAYLLKCEILVVGDNNSVSIGKGTVLNRSRIFVRGNNLRVRIGNGVAMEPGCKIDLKGNGGTIEIGNKSTFGRVFMAVSEDGGRIRIGEDSMFSVNVFVMTTDSHAIYDEQTRERTNYQAAIEVGDHV